MEEKRHFVLIFDMNVIIAVYVELKRIPTVLVYK